MARQAWPLRLRLLQRIYRARSNRRMPPGTSRLVASVEIISMVLWEKRTWAVVGIDIAWPRPRMRLLKGTELDADSCEAMPHPRRRLTHGATGEYRVPGLECGSAWLQPGTEVTAVVSWDDLNGSVSVLVRWRDHGAQMFGVFDAKDLVPID
jgi:hypothetical protein